LFLDEQRNIISLWKADDPAGLQLFYFAALELAWKIDKLPSWLITYFQNEINNEGNPTGIIYHPIFSKNQYREVQQCAGIERLISNASKNNLSDYSNCCCQKETSDITAIKKKQTPEKAKQ
jgi:hypothetical protein